MLSFVGGEAFLSFPHVSTEEGNFTSLFFGERVGVDTFVLHYPLFFLIPLRGRAVANLIAENTSFGPRFSKWPGLL